MTCLAEPRTLDLGDGVNAEVYTYQGGDDRRSVEEFPAGLETGTPYDFTGCP